MSPDDPVHSDIVLAERCLDGDPAALVLLQTTYRDSTMAFVVKVGGTTVEATEIVGWLWADLVTPNVHGRIPLASYDGSCRLQTWLNQVALNRLLTRKKIDRRREHRFSPLEGAPEVAGEDSSPVGTETPLLDLMRDAVESAFGKIPATDYVMLNLEHYDQLRRAELAVMFGISEATVSRRLDKARIAVSENVREHLRLRDPWLDLHWEDFLDLCRSMRPTCFGPED